MIAVPHDVPVAEGRAEPLSKMLLRWLRDSLIAGVPERFRSTPVQTEDYQAAAWQLVLVDPTGGAIDVTLDPRPRDGDEIAYYNASASANAVQLLPGSADHTVMGAASHAVTGARSTKVARASVIGGAVDWAVFG